MTDYFQLLNLARRPALDSDLLQQRFLELSASSHPDRVHGQEAPQREQAHHRYTELNAAYQCLRDPKERLRHLLELERGRNPAEVEKVLPATVEMGWEIARVCREADQALKEKKNAGDSPLLQLGCFDQVQKAIDQLREVQMRLNQDQQTLLEELERANAAWDDSRNAPVESAVLDRCEEVYRLLSYLQRWSRQLQSRVTELSV